MSGIATSLSRLTTTGALCLAALPALAGQFTIIHRFNGAAGGGDPAGPLVHDAYGNLYGVAGQGALGNGVIFRLFGTGSSPWKETVLYSFPAQPAGARPNPGLSIDRNLALYGTSMFAGGAGTVFRLTPPAKGAQWTLATLYAFPSIYAAAGAYPAGNLLLDSRGDIFGTTQAGGSETGQYPCQCGTAYELSPPSGAGPYTETVLHAFTNPPDAGLPGGGLTAGPDGTLFANSYQGGTGGCLDGSDVYVIGCGTIYSLTYAQGAWREQVLYNFRPNQENSPFDTLVPGPGGALFGIAGLDVLRLIPPRIPGGNWRHQVIYEFPGGYHGIAPAGTVVFDKSGNLYGATRSFGGAGVPTLYKLSPPATADAPWPETTLYTFKGAKNFVAQPNSALLSGPGNNFYGTVGAGNGQNGYIFAYHP